MRNTLPIHIPVYCDDIEMLGGALLVFDTIRVGFPNASITAHWMGYSDVPWFKVVKERCAKQGIRLEVKNESLQNHHLISTLLEIYTKGFIICDSDMIFWENCENFIVSEDYLIAGNYIPTYHCPIVKALTFERLHTSLLYFKDCSLIKEELANAYNGILKFCPFDAIKPNYYFAGGKAIFYDTCCNLYHTIGGQHFDSDMLMKFTHLNCGTYSKEVAAKCPEIFKDLPTLHQEIFKDKSNALAINGMMQAFYKKYALHQ